MELREIRTFLQVAQRKSFSKAAQALGYSQAAVTIQIKNLERELGTPLFERIGKQTSLTHSGQIFYDYASSILQELDSAREALAGNTELTGTLSIGTIESICASIFPALLSAFHKQYPKVRVRIVLDSPETLLDLMNKNALDLVYLLDQRIYDHSWEKVLEEPEDIVFVASASHPLAGRPSIPLEEILREPFLLTEKDASYRFVLDRYLAAEGKRIDPFLEIGNTEFILNMLKDGEGVSFLPEFAVREQAAAGVLSILPAAGFHMRIWRQLLYHRDKWLTREMRAFIELAKNPAVLP